MESTTTQKEAFDMLKQMNVPVTQQNLVYYAGSGNNPNILELLLKAGLNPNQTWTNEKGHVFYPLLNAVRNGTAKTVEILLNNGADINIQNVDKETAIYLAQKHKKDDIVQILKNAGAKELSTEEMNTLKKKIIRRNIRAGIITAAVFLAIFGGCYHFYNSSSSSGSSISSSQKTHTCVWCHKQYTGPGYYHIEDQCASTNADYDQCCSEKCCMEQWNSTHP